MRLLLIEDDVTVARVLADAFNAEGHETVVRHTGEEGLLYLERERPDAVMLDVLLPHISGIEVLRRIRASDDKHLPVIIVSGYCTGDDLVEVERLGVAEVIHKPLVLKHFTDALSRATQQRDRVTPGQDGT